jgi:hypothetical protein
MTLYGAELREKVCSGPLANDQEFTDEELADPILSAIDKDDPVARNPCLRRGPLHWEYYTQALAQWSRWIGKQWAALLPAGAPAPAAQPAP